MKSNAILKVSVHLFKGSDTILALYDLIESVPYDLIGQILLGVPKILTIPRTKKNIITHSTLRCQLLLDHASPLHHPCD